MEPTHDCPHSNSVFPTPRLSFLCTHSILTQSDVVRHVVGLIYPVAGGRRRLIRLRADSPFTDEPDSDVWADDVDTTHWFPRSGVQRARLSTLPADVQFRLPNHYSILTADAPGATPTNRNILNEWELPVRGNVIVLRHAYRNMMQVTNIHPAERRLVDLLVRE